MSTVPYNVSQLDPFLQRIMRQDITLKDDEVKEANRHLQNVLLCTMQNEMKRVDDTFRELYRKLDFVGSYYENLRVGHPSEFDFNLELQLPISESHIQILTEGIEPGFAMIKVNAQFHQHTSAAVRRKIESWLGSGYLCREKIMQWLQGVVDKALDAVSWPWNMTVTRTMSGPAVTLYVRENSKEFAVDLVPVFSFETKRWPPQPTRQLSGLPLQMDTPLKWCVVPKSPRHDPSSYKWRMSFYMYEKAMMYNQGSIRPVVKLMKLLRDKQNWPNLSSYYIKTVFLWEHVKHSPTFWRNGLGYLFMHMLGRLKDYLGDGRIPFFWDDRCNLISHLDQAEIRNMHDRVVRLKRQLELALSQPDRDLSSVVDVLFKSSTKTQGLDYTFGSLGQSSARSSSEAGALQQAESTDWSAVIGGVAAVGAVVLGSMLLWRNRNSD